MGFVDYDGAVYLGQVTLSVYLLQEIAIRHELDECTAIHHLAFASGVSNVLSQSHV